VQQLDRILESMRQYEEGIGAMLSGPSTPLPLRLRPGRHPYRHRQQLGMWIIPFCSDRVDLTPGLTHRLSSAVAVFGSSLTYGRSAHVSK
jgi:hypothetical protein